MSGNHQTEENNGLRLSRALILRIFEEGLEGRCELVGDVWTPVSGSNEVVDPVRSALEELLVAVKKMTRVEIHDHNRKRDEMNLRPRVRYPREAAEKIAARIRECTAAMHEVDKPYENVLAFERQRRSRPPDAVTDTPEEDEGEVGAES